MTRKVAVKLGSAHGCKHYDGASAAVALSNHAAWQRPPRGVLSARASRGPPAHRRAGSPEAPAGSERAGSPEPHLTTQDRLGHRPAGAVRAARALLTAPLPPPLLRPPAAPVPAHCAARAVPRPHRADSASAAARSASSRPSTLACSSSAAAVAAAAASCLSRGCVSGPPRLLPLSPTGG